MNRELVWKDLEIAKIFQIKKMILFRLNMVVFIKFQVRLFIKGAELNLYKMSEKNIESLEECWKKKFFLRGIFKNLLIKRPKLSIKYLKDYNSKIYRFIRSGSYRLNRSSAYFPYIIIFLILQTLLIHLKIYMY